MAQAARILNTTVHRIRRTLLIAKQQGPEALKATKWGYGVGACREEFTQEQKDWATSPRTLREQVGLSLMARKNIFNQEFGLQVSVPRFRRLYREAGVTLQKMGSRLGPRKLPSYAKQGEAIEALQHRLQSLLADGYELLTCDEALFSVDAYVQRHWTKKGDPIAKASRWSIHKPVVVFAVISASRGIVHYHFGVHSFNALDICTALQEVRAKVGNGVKIALGADNARIHRAIVVAELMSSQEVDIQPIWNVAARPDGLTVGVEQLWSQAKFLYRQ